MTHQTEQARETARQDELLAQYRVIGLSAVLAAALAANSRRRRKTPEKRSILEEAV